MNHSRGETCKKGTETGEEGVCVPRFWQFGEQQFGFRVVFIGPQVFKTKDANDSEGLGYGLLVPAGLWSMCWSLCPYESVTPNACSWRSLTHCCWGLTRRVRQRSSRHQQADSDAARAHPEPQARGAHPPGDRPNRVPGAGPPAITEAPLARRTAAPPFTDSH